MASTRLGNYPERFAAGVMLVNAGLGKLQRDKVDAVEVHAEVAAGYPFLEQLPPEQLAKILGVSEIVLGGALLVPLVGDGLAGVALTAFAGAMLSLRVRDPELRRGGGAPRQKGAAIARDVWLLGIGVGLAADAVRHRRRLAKAEL